MRVYWLAKRVKLLVGDEPSTTEQHWQMSSMQPQLGDKVSQLATGFGKEANQIISKPGWVMDNNCIEPMK